MKFQELWNLKIFISKPLKITKSATKKHSFQIFLGKKVQLFTIKPSLLNFPFFKCRRQGGFFTLFYFTGNNLYKWESHYSFKLRESSGWILDRNQSWFEKVINLEWLMKMLRVVKQIHHSSKISSSLNIFSYLNEPHSTFSFRFDPSSIWQRKKFVMTAFCQIL